MEEQLIKSLSRNLQLRELDLRGKGISDLSNLTLKVFSKMPYLRELNISDNHVSSLPESFPDYLQNLESLNLNNNQISDVFACIDIVSLLPKLRSLHINLNQEDQVDYILRSLPELQTLNGLAIDREDLYGTADPVHHQEFQSVVQLQQPSTDNNDFTFQNNSEAESRADNEHALHHQVLMHEQDRQQIIREVSPLKASSSKSSTQKRQASQANQSELQDESESQLINIDEFEEIANIYDQIRSLYSQVDPEKDSQLAQHFDQNLKRIMELQLDLISGKNSQNLPEMKTNDNSFQKTLETENSKKKEKSLKSKSELYEICSRKICEYLEEVDQLQNGTQTFSGVLKQIFQGLNNIIEKYSESFNSCISQKEKVLHELKVNLKETHQLLEAAEHLESQNLSLQSRIDELEREKLDCEKHIEELQSENKQYLERLVQNTNVIESKSAKNLLQKQMESISESPKRQPEQQTKIARVFQELHLKKGSGSSNELRKQSQNASFQEKQVSAFERPVSSRSHNENILKSNSKKPKQLGPTQNKNLSLKQLKELIQDIYLQKTKFDAKCEEGQQARETMEQYMYTYLNQRYGLKSLTIEWAMSIVNGIKKYQREDHDVALFGKILRNECDEEFRFIQETVKEIIFELLKGVIRDKHSTWTDEAILKKATEVATGNIERAQWRKILEKMYDKSDFERIETQIATRILQASDSHNELQKIEQFQKANQIKKQKLTRQELMLYQQSQQSQKVLFSQFLKVVLDFQLREHEKFLETFLSQFKQQDADQDGTLEEMQFRRLLKNIGIADQKVERILQIIDPYNNQKITFSECVHVLSTESVLTKEGIDIPILEMLYQNS